MARRLAQAERLAPAALQAAEAAAVQEAQQVLGGAAAQRQAAPEVWDVAVGPRPAAEPAGAARRLEAAAVQDVAAAVQRRAAGPASVAVRLRRGAGRGGAAAGGAGRAGGAAFGGCLGGASFDSLPGGPACAITIGAVCACEGMLANCAAVRAVVASSTRRRFVMIT